jgi:hypothetical protein
MPQSLFTGQLKEKPTYRVWCLYISFVHGQGILLNSRIYIQEQVVKTEKVGRIRLLISLHPSIRLALIRKNIKI